tara:strand:+ start:114 stop:440 length:327 start_codon:yes stop_codon:yes gene_type:complete
MTITEKYIDKIIPYIEGDVERELINGLYAYKFACPFCSMFCNNKHIRERKCASLVPVKDSYEYKFICSRSGAPECRRRFGGRSFYNFLLMINPYLHHQYKKELSTLHA